MDNPAQESNELDANSAADLFSSHLDNEPDEKKIEPDAESPEAAAERLLAEEAAKGEGTPTEAEETPKITIKVDGKIVELTEAEAEELYKGGMRQKDYTEKTMNAAEVRKAADAETAKARQERQAYADQLQTYSIQLQGVIDGQQQTDWQTLLDTDPIEYMKQQHLFQQRQVKLNEVQAAQAKIKEQTQAEQQEQDKIHSQAQLAAMIAKLPEWKDQAKAKEEVAKIKEYLREQGFDEEKIAGIRDHRDVLIQRKAMLYDALLARASSASKRVEKAPVKVERPGTGQPAPDKTAEAYKRLGKTGSVNDAAEYLTQFM